MKVLQSIIEQAWENRALLQEEKTTSAIRNAKNGQEFVEKVKNEIGIEIIKFFFQLFSFEITYVSF